MPPALDLRSRSRLTLHVLRTISAFFGVYLVHRPRSLVIRAWV
jgi:hypothetical protein